ncbi:MAG TPA: DeoR/GlpR family DNA-binding transcription regulator [Candidatus Limnocylindrales bacterium]|jgi:DeoR/GlpR family transcriptional regulator of sugar metabolism
MARLDSPREQLLPADRLQVIADFIRERGSVRSRDLVRALGVTDETIRRDLARLAEQGLVRRAHGGALAVRPSDETDTAFRLREHAVEKAAIGRRAAELVADGSSIILDSGTTTLGLARALRGKENLTVVTTAVTNALELVGNPTMSVIMTGGMIRPTTFGASGQLAAATLRGLHVDQTFLAIHSVSVAGGLTYPLFEEVDAKRAMIEAAAEVILLADHSKFGRQALVRVAPITAVQRIITTPGIDPAEAAAIRDLGIDLIIVEPDDDVADLERSAAAGQFPIPIQPTPA